MQLVLLTLFDVRFHSILRGDDSVFLPSANEMIYLAMFLVPSGGMAYIINICKEVVFSSLVNSSETHLTRYRVDVSATA